MGDEINWICNVEELNTTDILCRTPAISPYYNASVAQGVILTNRLMVDNTCGGVCDFTYLDASSSPKLTSMSSNTIIYGSITLTGVNLALGTPIVVLTNKDTSLATTVTPSSVNATSITFNVPNLETGSYNVKARLDPVGETNAFLLTITPAINAKTPSTFSTNGGRVVLSGYGLPNGWPNINYALKITQNNNVIQPFIFSATPTAFTLILPPSTSGDVFNISLTFPNKGTLSSIITSATANTPVLAITSLPTVSPGNIQFSFSQSNLKTAVPNFVEVYSLYNSNEVYNGTLGTSASGTVQFNATLTGGKYGFRFFFAAYGWSSCASTVSVTISAPTFTSLVSSYNGGSFLLSGASLSTSGTVKVNGVKTTIQNITGSNAVAIIPPFVTSETQTAFSLAEPKKLTSDQFKIISDTPASQGLAFDEFLGTVYTSTSTGNCFIGADVGAGLTLLPTRVRFFPNSKWIIASNYLLGATLDASNDNTNWVNLATVDSTVHSGWNIVPINTATKYRYLRFAHNTQSKCSLAQL